MNRCPKCDSPAPHLHPAVQHGGEVGTCTDDFHLTETPQNLPKYREAVHEARARLASPEVGKCDGEHTAPQCSDPDCWQDYPDGEPSAEVGK